MKTKKKSSTQCGYIKLYRSLIGSEVAKDKDRFFAWIHLLLLADWCGQNRGKITSTVRLLADMWDVDRSKASRIIKWLEEHEMIVVQATNKRGQAGTVITILNYDKYQAIIDETESETESETQNETQSETVKMASASRKLNTGETQKVVIDETQSETQNETQNEFLLNNINNNNNNKNYKKRSISNDIDPEKNGEVVFSPSREELTDNMVSQNNGTASSSFHRSDASEMRTEADGETKAQTGKAGHRRKVKVERTLLLGTFENVPFSQDELDKLKADDRFKDTWDVWIDRVSCYMAQSGKTYKSGLATIINWYNRDTEKGKVARSNQGTEADIMKLLDEAGIADLT